MRFCFGLLVVEGYLDGVASRKLLRSLDIETHGVSMVDKGGRRPFWKDVRKYNSASEQTPVWGLADLEKDPCPSGLIQKHVKGWPHRNFVLRIAEPMLESWLLADRQRLAAFLGVRVSQVPTHPEKDPNPKQRIVQLARISSRREIRQDLIPNPGSGGIVGPGYTSRMEEFISAYWEPERAAKCSQSLRRAIAAIRKVCT